MRDFGFAFDDNDFSDRVFHIEIISEGCDCVPDSKRKRKPGGQNSNKENGVATRSIESDSKCCAGVEVKTLQLSSPILAEKSPFFYKLFKNGMRESHQRHLTLKINASEEAALMDLLRFIYNNTLSATSTPDLLNVLMVADKFEVISCMRYCVELLRKLPMLVESALLYLELHSNVLMAEAVQPLKDAAMQYLVERYNDITKFQEEVMALPLFAIEVLIGSDSLQVNTEDCVFNLILTWARAHYPNLEERREILTKRLVHYMRFPNLSCSKLKEVLACPDFDHEQVSKLVLEALFIKVEVPYGKHIHASNDPSTTNRGISRRAYMSQLIKVVQFELPRPRCVVYFDLKKEDCAALFPSRQLYSQPFCLGGKWFFLMAQCSEEQESSFHHFGLYLQMKHVSETCTFDYEFAVMENPSKEFRTQFKVYNSTLTSGIAWGCRDLFETSWTNFMSDSSPYIIDGILHIRAELTALATPKLDTCL